MLVLEYIAKFLKEKDIKKVFGYQGGAVSKMIKTLIEQGNIEYIQAYHEQGAAFYADAYARVKGEMSVCIATNGPGATNLVSGIANAYLDSVPCLFITGQVNTTDIKSKDIRQNGFQEIDTEKLVKSITKYSKTIKNPHDIKYELQKAFYIANSGRKGSVLLDIPLDIQNMEIDENKLKCFKHKEKTSKVSEKDIKKILNTIKKAQKPIIVAGGGIRLSNALDDFYEFVNSSKIPFVTTLMGLDLHSEYNCGFSGLYGKTASNMAVLNADMVIILGSRLAKRQIGINNDLYFKKDAKIIHIDIDKAELGHSIKPYLGLNMSIKDTLREINKKIKSEKINFSDYKNWLTEIQEMHTSFKNNIYMNENSLLEPVKFVEKVSEYIPENSIITFDVGQNQMWSAQGFKVKKGQRILNSGGLGCMGFSLPAAIGAKFAQPDKCVVAFSGDGGLQMNIQELQKISTCNLGIKYFVFNNNSLGMIQEVQKKFLGETYYGTKVGYSALNLEKIATAYDLNYIKIEKITDLDILSFVFENKEAYIIDFQIKESPAYLLNKYCEIDLYKEQAK